LDTLAGKTIGLYAHFKGHAIKILDEVARELSARFSGVTFTHFQYLKEITELIQDDAYAAQAQHGPPGLTPSSLPTATPGLVPCFWQKTPLSLKNRANPR